MSTVSSNTTMLPWPEQRAGRGERLVVDGQVELLGRQVRAERAAHLHGAHGATAGGAATPLLDELAHRDAERHLDDAAAGDVAGQLEHLRAAAAAGAERGVGGRRRRRAPTAARRG